MGEYRFNVYPKVCYEAAVEADSLAEAIALAKDGDYVTIGESIGASYEDTEIELLVFCQNCEEYMPIDTDDTCLTCDTPVPRPA
jgi:hypothetical protein